MNNLGQETPPNNDVINMAESRPPVASAQGAKASMNGEIVSAPHEAGSTDIVEIMQSVGAAPDYDKTPPPTGDGLRPMSSSEGPSLRIVQDEPQVKAPAERDVLMDKGWENVNKAGKNAAEELFPEAMELGKQDAATEELPPVEPQAQEPKPTDVPPMTPEQQAKVENAAKDAVGSIAYKHIMRGQPKRKLL